MVNKHPIIDICVLTHNNIKTTIKFIKHLYSNTVDFNLIIVDNNSSDNTVNFLENLQKKENNITLFKSNENLGIAKGRNKAIQMSNAEWVFCIDNDQFPMKESWLDELFQIQAKGFHSVGVDAWTMLPPRSHRPYFPIKHCQTKFDRPTYVGGGGHLTPRKIFEELDFYDEYYSPFFFEDADFQFKMRQKGYTSAWHYAAKIYHAGHDTRNKQKSFNLQQQFQKNYKYFVKKWNPWFPQPINPLVLSKFIEREIK